MSLFNGEIKKYRESAQALADFQAKNKKVFDQLTTLNKNLESAKKDIKEITDSVVAENPEQFQIKENQELYNKDGLTIKAWPSYSTSFDLTNANKEQFEKLYKLNALTIDSKVFNAHLEAGRIDEKLKETVSKKVLGSTTCKIDFKP